MWRNYVRFFIIVNEKRHYKSSEDSRIPKQLETPKYEAEYKISTTLASRDLHEILRE
jgi:hypothetical protein